MNIRETILDDLTATVRLLLTEATLESHSQQLAAMTERAAMWERRHDSAHKDWAAAFKERDAARAEADALRTDRDLCKQDAENMAANAHRAEAERDALKARKVTLPTFRMHDDHYGKVVIVEEVERAIRAAGIEVAS